MIIPKCSLPTAPGTYLCWRNSNSMPELAEIRMYNGKLQYMGGNSVFYLDRLEAGEKTLFWGPITLE
jgi:hypothetical protein